MTTPRAGKTATLTEPITHNPPRPASCLNGGSGGGPPVSAPPADEHPQTRQSPNPGRGGALLGCTRGNMEVAGVTGGRAGVPGPCDTGDEAKSRRQSEPVSSREG